MAYFLTTTGFADSTTPAYIVHTGTITVVDYTAPDATGLEIQVNGVSATEGVNWTAGVSNAATANSIYTFYNAVNWGEELFSFSVQDNVVHVTKRTLIQDDDLGLDTTPVDAESVTVEVLT